MIKPKKERFINLRDDEVRAVLDGGPVEIRRPLKTQPVLDRGLWKMPEPFGAAWVGPGDVPCMPGHSLATRGPYGGPGDRLWVRETWAQVGTLDPPYTVYRATYPHDLPAALENVPADIREAGYRWRPSTNMPRVLSRLTVENVETKLEMALDLFELWEWTITIQRVELNELDEK